jgi:hypothetical protein
MDIGDPRRDIFYPDVFCSKNIEHKNDPDGTQKKVLNKEQKKCLKCDPNSPLYTHCPGCGSYLQYSSFYGHTSKGNGCLPVILNYFIIYL